MLIRLNGETYSKSKKKFVQFDHNHLMIFEALMDHGGRYRKYVDKQQKFRYSEHFGLVDFNNLKVDKLIVSARTARQDRDDTEILLPIDPDTTPDYEYMFHTHPPTPHEGARANMGVLYEFPSVSDIFHFIHHYNNGKTQGSIVVAPEGIYVIRSLSEGPINYNNENKIYTELVKNFTEIQRKAIQVYFDSKNETIDKEVFFSKIAQDQSYINEYVRAIQKWLPITIDYFPRTHNKSLDRWVFGSMKVPVEVVEKH